MNIECPCCGGEAWWKIVEADEKGYVWEAKCDECDWEDTKYEF